MVGVVRFTPLVSPTPPFPRLLFANNAASILKIGQVYRRLALCSVNVRVAASKRSARIVSP